jgi:hypothetical protein
VRDVHPGSLRRGGASPIPGPAAGNEQLGQGAENGQTPCPTCARPNPNKQITVGILNDISKNIEYVYNAPAMNKLRKISEREWYHLV